MTKIPFYIVVSSALLFGGMQLAYAQDQAEHLTYLFELATSVLVFVNTLGTIIATTVIAVTQRRMKKQVETVHDLANGLGTRLIESSHKEGVATGTVAGIATGVELGKRAQQDVDKARQEGIQEGINKSPREI